MKAASISAPKARGGRVRALVLAAILALPLVSCDLLFSGMFAADVAQKTAQVDLSAEILAVSSSSFSLAVLKLADAEYVLLFSSDGFDSAKTHLFVLSPALTVLNAYTLDDLTAVAPAGPFLGNAAVTRSPGQIIIGNLQAQAVPGAQGLDIIGKLPGSATLIRQAVVGPSPGYFVWTHFRSEPADTMVYQVYDSAWNQLPDQLHPIGRFALVRNVFMDPEDAPGQKALIVLEGPPETFSFIQVPKSPDLAGGSANLLDNPDYLPFTKTGLDPDSIALTSTGIVAYDRKALSWIRFLPSAPDTLSSMRVGRRDGAQSSAFSWSGGYFCTFDRATRVLTRYEDWW